MKQIGLESMATVPYTLVRTAVRTTGVEGCAWRTRLIDNGIGLVERLRLAGPRASRPRAESFSPNFQICLPYQTWHESHAPILPPELTRLRTLDSFRDRLRAQLHEARVVGPIGAPLGFCILKEDELCQLFVSGSSRGSGVAAALIAEAEARLAARGVGTAWLACAIGNARAARFYEKRGWRRIRTEVYHPNTTEGPFSLEVWRYEKSLQHPGSGQREEQS